MPSDDLISDLRSVLKAAGFRKRRRVWNRASEPFIDVIDVQTSKGLEAVTINVGVVDPGVYEDCWREELPAFVSEPFCTVRSRIGWLIGDRDVWWPVSDAQAGEQMADAVSAGALPFVDRMHSHEAMVEFLLATDVAKRKYPPPILYLAVLQSRVGDKTSGCSILDDLQQATVGPWQDRVAEVRRHIGCA